MFFMSCCSYLTVFSFNQALLEQGTCSDIAERMQDYQVIAMVILLGCVGYSSGTKKYSSLHHLSFFSGS